MGAGESRPVDAGQAIVLPGLPGQSEDVAGEWGISERLAELQNWLTDEITKNREKAKMKFLEVVGMQQQAVMNNLRDVMKKTLTADPDMWNFARSSTEGKVDVFVDEVDLMLRNTLKDQILEQQQADEQLAGTGRGCAICCFCMRLRAFILHHYLPHNRSLFGNLKDPIWWIITVSTFFGGYGVRIFTFTSLLVLHCFPCRPDEYQLAQFLVRLKLTQFIFAVWSTMLGAGSYYYCIAIDTPDDGRHVLDCANEDALGAFHLEFCVADYLGSWLLIWPVVFAIACSTYLKKPSYVIDHTPTLRVNSSCCFWRSPKLAKGYRVYMYLWYDTFWFFISLVWLLCVVGATCADDLSKSPVTDWHNNSLLKAHVYWARAMYQIFAFPMVFVQSPLPMVNFSLFTPARPTGYNSQGACVKWMLPTRATPAPSVPPVKLGAVPEA